VITTDMGLNDSLIRLQPFCGGVGDDGVLLGTCGPRSTSSIGPFDDSDPSASEECDHGPDILTLGTPNDVVAQVFDVGTNGCGFEQPLDAMFKALAPSSVSFPSNHTGHGNALNAGFLREDAALAVVIFSDEDDCSVTPEGMPALFDDYSPIPEAHIPGSNQTPIGLNLRCFYRSDPQDRMSQVEHAGFVQPPSRYFADFVQSVKPNHPESVAFMAITGIPDGTDGLSPEAILAHPGMDFATDPLVAGGDPTQRMSAARDACRRCQNKSPEECIAEPLVMPDGIHPNPEVITGAKPATRLVRTAQGFGDNGLVRSICAESYAPALDGLVQKIAGLQRAPNPVASGCTP
jgi:hypothetical protein